MDTKIITKEELAEHNNGTSTWISIHDRIYDCTKFLEEVGILTNFGYFGKFVL